RQPRPRAGTTGPEPPAMPDTPPSMTSHRPYLLRALYEWITDNGMTPHILADASMPGVRVPAHTVKDGRVVLNIADRAGARLERDYDAVRFPARVGGVRHAVQVPVGAGLAIYARQAGQGLALPEDVPQGDDPPPPDAEPTPPGDGPDGGPGG